jgi:hypothetical protein
MKQEADEPNAYLTEDVGTYVSMVLDKQKGTVAALEEAGLSRWTIMDGCIQAVTKARELPALLEAHRERADRAKAAYDVLPTVRTFAERLYSTDAGMIQTLDKALVNRVLDYIAEQAERYRKPDPADYHFTRQPGQTEVDIRWSAVRIAVGWLSVFIERKTGSPNEPLVANLANELFPTARPGDKSIDDDTVRRCRKEATAVAERLEALGFQFGWG